MMATYNTPVDQPGGAQHQLPPHQQYQQVHRIQQQQQQQMSNGYTAVSVQEPQGASVPPRTRPGHEKQKSRTFSFASNNSGRSGHSGSQKQESETHAEKESKRLHSKADPTLAMIEAEPSAVAASGDTSIANLRNITHRDPFGNPIAEPDHSNPTRYRWERPLDTIRSFEAAIDGAYNRRSTYYQGGDSESVAGGPSRRNSYYHGNGNNARYTQDGRSQFDQRQSRDNNADQNGYYGGHGQRNRFNGRTGAEPQFTQPQYRPQGEQNVYPAANNHRSYETVTSGSNGEGAAYMTDPTSSDSSSLERRQSPLKQQQQQQQYQGYQQNPQSQQYQQYQQYQQASRAPIKLSSSTNDTPPAPPAHQQQRQAAPTAPAAAKPEEKQRKSWLSRKLSRRN